MIKAEYNQMVSMQESAHDNAWNYIFSNWACTDWQPLPKPIKDILGLHSAIGICSSMLITKTGSSGLTEFIHRMNSKRA